MRQIGIWILGYHYQCLDIRGGEIRFFQKLLKGLKRYVGGTLVCIHYGSFSYSYFLENEFLGYSERLDFFGTQIGFPT